MRPYHDYNDQELLSYIAEDQEEASDILYQKYEPLIYKTAKKMLPFSDRFGIDLNDLMQEGRLGLAAAIRQYDPNQKASFYTFAKTCIERNIISYTISAKRLKHKILNESISIEGSDTEGNSFSLEKFFQDEKENPEMILFKTENEKQLYDQLKKQLTELESQVLELKYHGCNYKEIATLLDKPLKSIDNAIQRIKNKLQKIINE